MRIALLGLDVDRVVAVERVHHRWQHQVRWVGAGETAVAVHRPLHRRAYAVAVAEKDVVAHADLVAVVNHRRTGHGKQQTVEQLDPPPVTLQQRRQAPAYAQVDPCALVRGVVVPQVVALLVGHHLQRQLVVVAQEDSPLAIVRDVRRLAQDVGDREAVFLSDGHVHARHQREVEGHVAFVTRPTVFAAEIQLGVFRPLVGFGEQHAVGVVGVDLGADRLEHRMGLRQVLVVGAVAFDQVRNRIQAQAVDAHVQPVAHYRQHGLHHLRIVEVEVWLVRIEAVPEVLLGHRVPGPVGFLGVEKDDSRAVVFLVGIRPDVEIPGR